MNEMVSPEFFRNRFWFTKFAKKQIYKVLPKNLRYLFWIKVEGLRDGGDLMTQLKPLQNLEPATHSIRIGNDRLILKRLGAGRYYILDIENLRGTWEENALEYSS